jgi:ATP-dependent Lhr-like helicase
MAPKPPAALEYAGPPTSAEAALAALAGPVARWFRQRYGEPTAVQRLAWPPLALGRHVLVSAPTGMGKTLAAFLPILSELICPEPEATPSALRCLYVAPLKALGNDACRNLQRHLDELGASLPPGGCLPRLAVRTGDTPARERRRLAEDPPDILLTTPESLAVLLSQPALQPLFAGLRWVVIDEVHALAGTKRGADLAVSLERLSALAAREVRRVGLSATATPLPEAARFLVGAGRPCTLARAVGCAPPQLAVTPLDDGGSFLATLVARLVPELQARRSTLVFANTRGLAERLAWALRRQVPEWDALIAVHHSALAAARRQDVEERFKQGRLRVVVSSTSLELGIDIGAVELVVLVHPPGDVVRLLQRVGRSGHGPGGVKRGLVLTATAAELLEAAVTAASGQAAQCEPLRVPAFPLDVLCQQVLGMAAARTWAPDEMFALVRRAAPYAGLPRRDFDDCLAYLRGLDRDGRSWLPARLREDGDGFAIRDARTARLLRRNLGTILAAEAVPVLIQGTEDGERRTENETSSPYSVGEVDQSFADRLQPGDRFLLDGRCLELRRKEGGALLVEEVAGRPRVPRWGGEGWPLSTELARRLYLLRVQAAEALREGPDGLAGVLRRDYGLEGAAVDVLVDYFQRQEGLSEVPDATACLVEAVAAEQGADYYVHTPLNRLGNDALARAAVYRLARDHGRSATSVVADLGFALTVPGGLGDVPEEQLRTLLRAEDFDADLDAALADSLALRERFRRVALTGFMLLRNPLGRRPRVGGGDWGERRLFDQVRARDPDFVLLRQAAREVRADCCDVPAARDFVRDLGRRSLRCRWLPHVSPFVEAWTQTGLGGVGSVETPAEALRRLHAALMGGAAGDARPV